MVPRQFMDLGLASGADEASNSSTEEGSPERCGSPPNNAEVVSMDYSLQMAGGKAGDGDGAAFDHDKPGDGDDGREDSAGREESHGWASNKLTKINPAARDTSEPPQEAMMRKARVSVRARSEAPMVGLLLELLPIFCYRVFFLFSSLRGIIDPCDLAPVDYRRMPMEEVRSEDGQGKSLPEGLLPLHHGGGLPRPQASNDRSFFPSIPLLQTMQPIDVVDRLS